MKFFSKVAVARFRRRLEHVSIHIILPTVVNAAQPALFVAPEIQRCPAVGAVLGKQADASLSVSKSYQFLAQHAHPSGRAVTLGDFFGQERWNPVAPDKLAHGHSPVSLGKKLVIFYRQHGKSP